MRNYLKLEMKVKKLHPLATIPQYQTDGAAGLDLTACENMVIPAGERRIVSSGIAIQLPEGHEGQVRPRSGLSFKYGITVLNSPGTIDEDYRGEVKTILYNSGKEDFHINVGDRIAQLIVSPVTKVKSIDVTELDETNRGTGGFGSTGIK